MNGASPSLRRSTSVFINCPFDGGFTRQRNALVLACVLSGFYPVMADSGPGGRPRLERILSGLMGSRYSIHDLSRCRGEGDANLARFNMPLELGMAMALRAAPAAHEAAHEYLILVPDDRGAYRRFVSDLAGFDPPGYDGTPARIALEGLAWLQTATEAPAALAPRDLLPKLSLFDAAMERLAADWQGGTIPWDYVVAAAADVASQ